MTIENEKKLENEKNTATTGVDIAVPVVDNRPTGPSGLPMPGYRTPREQRIIDKKSKINTKNRRVNWFVWP